MHTPVDGNRDHERTVSRLEVMSIRWRLSDCGAIKRGRRVADVGCQKQRNGEESGGLAPEEATEREGGNDEMRPKGVSLYTRVDGADATLTVFRCPSEARALAQPHKWPGPGRPNIADASIDRAKSPILPGSCQSIK
jgi:hypothetical protein